MTAVHHQSLFLCHLAQVVHHQAKLNPGTMKLLLRTYLHSLLPNPLHEHTITHLGPVTEHLSIPSVGDELLGKLKDKEELTTGEINGLKNDWPCLIPKLLRAVREAHLSNGWVQVVHDH